MTMDRPEPSESGKAWSSEEAARGWQRGEAARGQALAPVNELMLDLAGVTFLDSCGLHLAMNATQLAAAQGVRFVVAPGPPHVQRIFELSGVVSVVPFAARSGLSPSTEGGPDVHG